MRFGGVFRSPKTPLLARLPTRLPPWPWRNAGRVRAFPLVRRIGYQVVLRGVRSPGASGPAPGVTPRWHALLSWNKSSIRKPAQHKAGSSRARRGTRLNGRFRGSRPSQGRRGWNGCSPSRLQEWRVRHAPARARGPGVGKVLRKVSIDPPRVNLHIRLDRDVKPRRADSRTRFRTREEGQGLTASFRKDRPSNRPGRPSRARQQAVQRRKRLRTPRPNPASAAPTSCPPATSPTPESHRSLTVAARTGRSGVTGRCTNSPSRPSANPGTGASLAPCRWPCPPGAAPASSRGRPRPSPPGCPRPPGRSLRP